MQQAATAVRYICSRVTRAGQRGAQSASGIGFCVPRRAHTPDAGAQARRRTGAGYMPVSRGSRSAAGLTCATNSEVRGVNGFQRPCTGGCCRDVWGAGAVCRARWRGTRRWPSLQSHGGGHTRFWLRYGALGHATAGFEPRFAQPHAACAASGASRPLRLPCDGRCWGGRTNGRAAAPAKGPGGARGGGRGAASRMRRDSASQKRVAKARRKCVGMLSFLLVIVAAGAAAAARETRREGNRGTSPGRHVLRT